MLIDVKLYTNTKSKSNLNVNHFMCLKNSNVNYTKMFTYVKIFDLRNSDLMVVIDSLKGVQGRVIQRRGGEDVKGSLMKRLKNQHPIKTNKIVKYNNLSKSYMTKHILKKEVSRIKDSQQVHQSTQYQVNKNNDST